MTNHVTAAVSMSPANIHVNACDRKPADSRASGRTPSCDGAPIEPPVP